MAQQIVQKPIRPKGERRRLGKPLPPVPGQRQPRQLDKEHKGRIAKLRSILSGDGPCEVCHVRYADATHMKRSTGMQEKPSDMWTLPLTPGEHRLGNDAQHSTSEREWWAARGIDPLQACKDLYSVSLRDDLDEVQKLMAMEDIVSAHRVLGEIRRSI